MANISRIADSALFGILIVALFCLIIISPVDSIYQCYRTQRLTDIFFIAGAYLITFFLAVFIYASRIYTNRTVLASIPKAWIPVEREDLGPNVRGLVEDGLSRSAIIAYQARPRDMGPEEQNNNNNNNNNNNGYEREEWEKRSGGSVKESLLVDPDRPPWGKIQHPGWSSPSPSKGDLANLPYREVLREIPYLIEAKAVSLVPFEQPAMVDCAGGGVGVPDTRVVEVLQRPASMGLREYVQHLMSFELINPPELAGEFIPMYAYARFSMRALHEDEFRRLMHVFAQILRGMRALSPQMIDEVRRRNNTSSYSGSSGSASDQGSYYQRSSIAPSEDEDEDGEGETEGETTNSFGGDDNSSSSIIHRGRRQGRDSSSSFRRHDADDATAPAAANSPAPSVYRLSAPDIAQRAGLPSRRPSSLSVASLQPVRSNVSASSGGSVIRLADNPGPTDLPYIIDRSERLSRG